MRAQLREERTGAITDVYFVPEAHARDQAIEPGGGDVEISAHLISLTYQDTLYPHNARYAQGLLDGKFIGQRSPASGKVRIPSKGYDAIARVMLTQAHDVERVGSISGRAMGPIKPILSRLLR